MAKGPWILGATVLGLGGLLVFDQVRFGDPFALSSASAGLKAPVSPAKVKAPAATGTVRRATGDAVPNQYGAVQVKVAVRGGTLTGITFLQLPYGDPESASISDRVAPVLAQQALDAQSANVAGVSGATYTSDSYRQSLQSALDRLAFGQ